MVFLTQKTEAEKVQLRKSKQIRHFVSTFVIIQNKNSSFKTVFLPSPKTYIRLGYIADLMDAVVGTEYPRTTKRCSPNC